MPSMAVPDFSGTHPISVSMSLFCQSPHLLLRPQPLLQMHLLQSHLQPPTIFWALYRRNTTLGLRSSHQQKSMSFLHTGLTTQQSTWRRGKPRLSDRFTCSRKMSMQPSLTTLRRTSKRVSFDAPLLRPPCPFSLSRKRLASCASVSTTEDSTPLQRRINIPYPSLTTCLIVSKVARSSW